MVILSENKLEMNQKNDHSNGIAMQLFVDNNLDEYSEKYGIKYIIGDRFYEFSRSNHVVSVSEFFYQMKRVANFSRTKEIYYFGQGISDEEKKAITKYCIKNNITIFNNGEAADSALTHKLKQENIMITDPLKISENLYQSNLLINDECAEMSDHVTGHHIQGMVLIEAARQMMLAVSEKFILGNDSKGKAYCILNNVVTSFNQFVFPIEVVIEHAVVSLKSYRNGTYAVRCKTRFIQDDKVATEVDIEYKLYDKNFMSKKEEEIAEKCLENAASKIRNSLLKKSM